MSDDLQFHKSSSLMEEEQMIGGSFERNDNTSDEEDGLNKMSDRRALVDGDDVKPSFWSFQYYQQYFDVDTDQVVRRIIHSMVPRVGVNYIEKHIRPKPDLYGPFWTGTSVVFAMAICGNLSNYFTHGGYEKDYHWEYDFRIVSISATIIFSYVWLVPMLLYGLLRWRSTANGHSSYANYSYTEIVGAYGYSLAIFVFVSVLWMVPNIYFQWVVAGIALILSGCVMAFSFWPAFKDDNKTVALVVTCAIIGLHILVVFGFKEYLYHIPDASSESVFLSTLPPFIKEQLTGMSSVTADVLATSLTSVQKLTS